MFVCVRVFIVLLLKISFLFYLFFDEVDNQKQTNNAVSNCLKAHHSKHHTSCWTSADRLYTTNAIVMNAPEQTQHHQQSTISATPTSPPPTTNSGSTDSIVLALKTDERFQPFLKEDFSPAQYASEVLASSNGVQTASNQLTEGINILEKAVRDEVTRSYDVLMNQLTGIEDAEKILHTLRNGVNSLHQTTAKVRTEIAEPHKIVSAKTKQLERLTTTTDVLHRVVRAVKLTQRLRACVESSDSSGGGRNNSNSTNSSSSSIDFAKAAKLIHELRELEIEASDSLFGVECVDAQREWVVQVTKLVRREANEALKKGMEVQSQADVGNALQVHYNLDELSIAVDVQVNQYASIAIESVKEATDWQKIQSAASSMASKSSTGLNSNNNNSTHSAYTNRSGVSGGQEEIYQNVLWERLESCFEVVHESAMSVWHLQRVLAKKRDPLSHALFLDEVLKRESSNGGSFMHQNNASSAMDNLPCAKFWVMLGKGMTDHMSKTHASAGFVRDVLLQGFPHLMNIIESMHDRCSKDGDAKGVPGCVRKDGADLSILRRSTDAISHTFFSRSYNRLSEPINSGFSSGRNMSRGDSDKFLARIREEMVSVEGHASLVNSCAGGVSKALKLLAQKAEYSISSTDWTAEKQRIYAGEPPSSLQRMSLALATELNYIVDLLQPVVNQYSTVPKTSLQAGIDRMKEACFGALSPIFEALEEKVEKFILMRVHDEDWENNSNPLPGGSSYVSSLTTTLKLFQENYLNGLISGHFSSSFGGETSSSSHHASSSSGRSGTGGLQGISSTSTGPIFEKCGETFENVIDSFVRNASLIQKLSISGSNRLAKDCVEVEAALRSHLLFFGPLTSDDAKIANLHAFKRLMFCDNRQILSVVGKSNSPDASKMLLLEIHHLYSQCDSTKITTPWARAGMNPKQYYTWWKAQKDVKEVLRGVQGSLDASKAEDDVTRTMRELCKLLDDTVSIR